jgi:hypothetical protein
LAIATNLPEIAIVAAAAVSGNIGVAVGNILGGIAIQTVVLVALDAFGVRGSRPLTYRAASLVLVLEAALVGVVLAIVIGGSQMPPTLIPAPNRARFDGADERRARRCAGQSPRPGSPGRDRSVRPRTAPCIRR